MSKTTTYVIKQLEKSNAFGLFDGTGSLISDTLFSYKLEKDTFTLESLSIIPSLKMAKKKPVSAIGMPILMQYQIKKEDLTVER